MRIGLLLDPYGEDTPAGLGRYVYEFAKALVAENREDTFTFFTRNNTTVSITGTVERTTVLPSLRLWLMNGKELDETLDCHIFFTPVIPLFFRPKHLVVIAPDFAYLELPHRSIRQTIEAQFLKMLHARAFRKADAIVAISHATKASLLAHFNIPTEHVTVVHLGYVVQNVSPVVISVPEKFFLFAGVFKERKNVRRVIEAFASFNMSHPGYHLVLTGKKKGDYYDSLVHIVQEHGLQNSVHFLGYVTDGELAYLYQHTVGLVFPSLIEGFGMPILEAMHAGAPVITSNTGALAEVAGDCALLANPHDASDIASKMSTLVTDPTLAPALREKGSRRVLGFTWEKSARELSVLIHPQSGGGVT